MRLGCRSGSGRQRLRGRHSTPMQSQNFGEFRRHHPGTALHDIPHGLNNSAAHSNPHREELIDGVHLDPQPHPTIFDRPLQTSPPACRSDNSPKTCDCERPTCPHPEDRRRGKPQTDPHDRRYQLTKPVGRQSPLLRHVGKQIRLSEFQSHLVLARFTHQTAEPLGKPPDERVELTTSCRSQLRNPAQAHDARDAVRPNPWPQLPRRLHDHRSDGSHGNAGAQSDGNDHFAPPPNTRGSSGSRPRRATKSMPIALSAAPTMTTNTPAAL